MKDGDELSPVLVRVGLPPGVELQLVGGEEGFSGKHKSLQLTVSDTLTNWLMVLDTVKIVDVFDLN